MTDDLDQTTITPPDFQEPATNGVPASPVLPPSARGRSGQYRWVVAAGVVALVVVLSALAIGLFTGRSATAVVLGYVPADSLLYAEARLDLPGDQRVAVGQFLSKFPGFADQSIMESKIDEVLDRIVAGASDDSQSFSLDIKPWFAGEVAFSLSSLPDPATLSSPDASVEDARYLGLVSVKDEAGAVAWFDSAITAEIGAAPTTESYKNATIHNFKGGDHPPGAYAVLDGKVAVIGDPASVKASVDAKETGSLASNEQFKAALDATSGDHVGFVYVALRPLIDWSMRVGESTGGAPAFTSDVFIGLVPDWAAFALRAEADALRLESISQRAADAPAVAERTSTVALHVPSSTIALSVSPNYGKGLLDTLELYRAEPSMKEATDAIDQALGVLGGPEAAASWIGDLGVTVSRTASGVEGGLVIVPTDRPAAERFFTSLRTLLSLGGATLGVEVREEMYAGTTITIVDLGDTGDLAGMAGLPPGVSLGGEPLNGQHVELAYALTDDVVVLGSSPEFVRHVLDTTAESSLAESQRFKELAGRVGKGPGLVFADITALRELFDGVLSSMEPAEVAAYESDVKPFLAPFDALIGSTSMQGEINRNSVIVTVK